MVEGRSARRSRASSPRLRTTHRIRAKAAAAVEDDGKAADEDVANAFRVQRFAEREEVFELRCACVSGIVLIIHSSASS